MKGFFKCIMLLLVMSCLAANTPEPSYQGVSVSMQVFYDDLSPYGRWIHDPVYGYVWVPDAGPDFSPYSSNGYWVFTEYGWSWVSNYPWGWAPFHYGRWYYDPFYGSVWVPGYEWGPAWVCWRHSAGYYGWAPLQPGISVSVGYSNYNPGPRYWRFVRQEHFGSSNVSTYYENQENNVKIINNSTVIRNTHVDNTRKTTYIAGPERAEVQKLTKTTIKPVKVEETNKPGEKLNNDRLQVYRPMVQKNNDEKAAPAKFENAAQHNDGIKNKQARPTQAPVPQTKRIQEAPVQENPQNLEKRQPEQNKEPEIINQDKPAQVTPAQPTPAQPKQEELQKNNDPKPVVQPPARRRLFQRNLPDQPRQPRQEKHK